MESDSCGCSGVGVYFYNIKKHLEKFHVFVFCCEGKNLLTTFFYLATERKSQTGACLKKFISDPGLFLLVRQKHVSFLCVVILWAKFDSDWE